MQAIIVGYGEVGQAVHEVFRHNHEIQIHDPMKQRHAVNFLPFRVMCVCMPYSDQFLDQVWHYQQAYQPKVTIVFSTVPIGTTAKLEDAIHSPVEGKHPELANSMKSSPRWAAPYDMNAEKFFVKSGLSVRWCKSSQTTEFLKLRSTAKYGVNIEWTRYEKAVCDELDIPFENVKRFDRDYNILYQQLGLDQFQRYILDPPEGPIGGHCIRPNAAMLDEQYPSEFLNAILKGGLE